MSRIIKYSIFLGVPLLIWTCKKDSEFDNPYDQYTPEPLYTDQTPLAKLSTDNFAYLQNKIFAPTCANSGCHDGAFEPDFRTIASSYNSIVYQPVITNDPSNSFVYRVDPGSAANSLVHERLINALPNTTGIMPAVGTPDWTSNKATYIAAIRSWINNGAKDMYGNIPSPGNPDPITTGFLAFADGNTTTPYNRAPGSGVTPIAVPRTDVDLWFTFVDDQTSPSSFTVNEIKISENMFDFEGVAVNTLTTSSSLTADDFENNSVTYTHKYDFDASAYPSGTILYVRVYVQDADHLYPVETPNVGSSKQVLYLFSLYVN